MYKDKLQELRENNNLTQENIANTIGIERGAYSQYEIEYFIMPIKHLNTICDFFNVSLDYIFNFNDKIKYTGNLKNIDKIKSGLRLKEFRKENKITQEKLATILNTNRSVIANYERGRNCIATPFLYTICKKYKISADYLLGKIDNPKYLK